jgi:hypothetical protein
MSATILGLSRVAPLRGVERTDVHNKVRALAIRCGDAG